MISKLFKRRILPLTLAAVMVASIPVVSFGGTAKDESTTYRYLTKSMGLNKAAASAVMTNLQAESGIRSDNLENLYNIRYGLSDAGYTSRVNKGLKKNGKYKSGFGKTRYFTKDYCGYGICQWTSLDRRKKLLKKALAKKTGIDSLPMQLEFLRDELKGSYPQVWTTLKNVPNTEEGAFLAAAHFCMAFEIPAHTERTSNRRGKKALGSYWKKYSGKKVSTNDPTYLGLCGYIYPKNVKKGNSVFVGGYTISNKRIRSITVKILNARGKTVYSKTTLPASTAGKISKPGSYLRFGRLSKGRYTYVVTAKGQNGRVVSAAHSFTVSNRATATGRAFSCTNKAKAYVK